MNDQEVRLCPYCRSPQPRRDCEYCPTYRLLLQKKDESMKSLRQEVYRLKDVVYELDGKDIEVPE